MELLILYCFSFRTTQMLLMR